MKNEMNFDFDQEFNMTELNNAELNSISGGTRTTDILERVLTIVELLS
jgi:bacteriocin-like protein